MYLGIDYGTKRIGLALGKFLPKPMGVIDGRKGRDFVYGEIKRICLENDVELIVIGIPVLASGTEGSLSNEIRQFSDGLSKITGLEIVFEPEQFSSIEAERILEENNLKWTRENGEKDQMAAVLILEQYIRENGQSIDKIDGIED